MERPKAKAKKPELLYIIGCEGINQEKLYFEKIEELFNGIEQCKYNITFDYAEPFGGDPECVVKRVIDKSIGKLDKAAVFDYDGKTSKYENAIDLGIKNDITLGYTNYCFDLWLIWHKSDYSTIVKYQGDYAKKLKEVYNLPAGCNMKNKNHVNKILEQIDLSSILDAILRAELVEKNNKKNHKGILTNDKNKYYENPDTQLHNMLKLVLSKAGIELNDLKQN